MIVHVDVSCKVDFGVTGFGALVGYLNYVSMAFMLGYFSPLCAEAMTVVEGYVSKSPFRSAA